MAATILILLNYAFDVSMFGNKPSEVPGYTTIMLTVLLLGGINFTLIGILGLYIGRRSIGAGADLIFFDLAEPRYAGLWMPEYAPIVCGEPVQIARTMINGRWRVIDGQLVDTDIKVLLLKAEEKIRGLSNRIARV